MNFIRHQKVESPHPSVRNYLGSDYTDLLDLGAIYLNEKRLLEDCALKIGDILRIHTKPRRFASPRAWSDLILFENSEYMIVDKPHGVPVHAHLDNAVENLCYQLKVHPTHRIDLPTRGLVVLAKDAETQARLQKQFSTGRIRKRYFALVNGQPELGLMENHMLRGPRAPKVLFDTPGEDTLYCRSEVLKVKPLSQEQNLVELELYTGRTHQLRAQLARRGHFIAGDTLYQGGPDSLKIALLSYSLHIEGRLYTWPGALNSWVSEFFNQNS